MTGEPTEPYSDNNEFHETDMRVYGLIGVLESHAQAYSPDYAEGIEDGCGASIRTIDYGGQLTTSVGFTAERYREEPSPGVFGEEMARTYDIDVSIRHQCPDFASFPEAVREYIEELGEYDEDILDSNLLFSIEFRQKYTVDTDGWFEYEYDLQLNIGEDSISLPDMYESDDTRGLDEALTEEDLQDHLFTAIFSADELTEIAGAFKRVQYERSSEKILDMFLDQVSAIRFVTKDIRLEMAKNIVDSIFCDTSQGPSSL